MSFCKPRTVGIYEIVHVPTNRRYIGQSQDVNFRLQQHFSAMRLGKHTNRKLQIAWNESSKEDFIGQLIMECELIQLPQLEFFWISQCQPEFNASLSTLQGARGWKMPRETVERLRKFNKERWADPELRKQASEYRKANLDLRAMQVAWDFRKGLPHTPEARAKISESNKGKVLSEDTKRKLREYHAANPQTHSWEVRALISYNNRNKKLTVEGIEKMRRSLTGRKLSERHKANVSKGLIGHACSEKTRALIRQKTLQRLIDNPASFEAARIARRATKCSEETKELLRRQRVGKKFSDGTKRKMSEPHKRRLGGVQFASQ